MKNARNGKTQTTKMGGKKWGGAKTKLNKKTKKQ